MVILVVDDDEDDRLLVEEGLRETQCMEQVYSVSDGMELMDYLEHSSGVSSPNLRPDLILLDLNMPMMDGREALELIKSSAAYRSIPVVILTTSDEPEEILRCYALGANSFITKPSSFDELVRALKELTDYWTRTVKLPPREDNLLRSIP